MQRILIFIILFSSQLFSQTFYQPTNMNFEIGEIGKLPVAWDISRTAEEGGYEAFLDLTDSFSGKYYAKLQKLQYAGGEKDSAAPAGSLYQSIDALGYRDYNIRFKVALKTKISDKNSSAHIFIQITSTDNSNDIFKADMDNPIIADEWTYFDINLKVPENANKIRYGIFLQGIGVVQADDASLEIIQPDNFLNSKPKELNDSTIDHLYSLAKLYGYVRFFYPSNENISLNWDKFMLYAVNRIENTKNLNQLKEELENIFSYPAPLLNINDFRNKKLRFADKPENSLNNYAVSWLHSGGFSPRATQYIYSTVHNVYEPLRPREAAAFQVIDVKEYADSKITVYADFKVKAKTPGSGAMIWLRVDNDVKRMIAIESSHIIPENKNEWNRYKAVIYLPKQSEILRIGSILKGEGEAWFDNFTAITEDGDTMELKNPGYENNETAQLNRGWIVPGSVFDAGYSMNVVDSISTEGRKSLHIASSAEDIIHFPRIGYIHQLELGNELYANMPSVLYADSSGALPKSDLSPDYVFDGKPSDFYPNADDRISRIAIAIMAWSILDNFNIKNLSDQELKELFKIAIKKAALDNSKKEFIETLRLIAKKTNDSQARVWKDDDSDYYALPFLIEDINGKLIVTKTKNTKEIFAGNEIILINGEPAYQYIVNMAKKIPSSSQNWAVARAIAMFRSGKLNSSEKITFKNDNKEITKEFKREILLKDLNKDRIPEIFEVDTNTLYLDITILNDKFLKNNLDKIAKYDNLIFDARGSVDVTVHALGQFIEKPIFSVKWEIPVYTYPDKSKIFKKSIQGIIKNHGKLVGKRLILLADKLSKGYTEAFLRVAQEYNIGEIIGEKTAGSPGDVLAFRLPGNYSMSMTVMRAYSPSGVNISGIPINPDLTIKKTVNDVKNKKDPIFEKALEIIKK